MAAMPLSFWISRDWLQTKNRGLYIEWEQRIRTEGAFKALFTWREEDPRTRNNFSFGIHAEISVGAVTEWRRKKE